MISLTKVALDAERARWENTQVIVTHTHTHTHSHTHNVGIYISEFEFKPRKHFTQGPPQAFHRESVPWAEKFDWIYLVLEATKTLPGVFVVLGKQIPLS